MKRKKIILYAIHEIHILFISLHKLCILYGASSSLYGQESMNDLKALPISLFIIIRKRETKERMAHRYKQNYTLNQQQYYPDDSFPSIFNSK